MVCPQGRTACAGCTEHTDTRCSAQHQSLWPEIVTDAAKLVIQCMLQPKLAVLAGYQRASVHPGFSTLEALRSSFFALYLLYGKVLDGFY
jgi:hypothetical protein